MADKKPKNDKDKKRKKTYVIPKLVIAGSLLTISQSALFAISIQCCITERLKLARRETRPRNLLMTELAEAMARD